MEHKVARFNARSETGKEYIMIKFVEVHENHDLSGKVSKIRGRPRFALEDGSAVMPIDDKTFKIVQTEEIIRKVD